MQLNPLSNASMKNSSIGGAGIGDGDLLAEQATQQILARRKKLTQTPQAAAYGAQGMGGQGNPGGLMSGMGIGSITGY